MKVQVETEDGTLEVEHTALQLPEGANILKEGEVPDGYYTEDAVQQRVQDRLDRKEKSVKSDLKENKDFHKEIFSQYDITLDKEGNPKGLKPDFDPEEWKQNKLKQATKPLEEKIDTFKKKYQRSKKARIQDAILANTKGAYKEMWTQEKDDGHVKPLVVKQHADQFDEDEDGNIWLVNDDGSWRHGPNGRISPKDYLLDEDKFGDRMIDKRQRSSKFSKGGEGGKKVWSEEEIGKMSDAEYEKNRDEIQKAQADGRIE